MNAESVGRGREDAVGPSKRVSIVARPWFWLALIAIVFGAPLVRNAVRARQHTLPVMWQLPRWQLVDQQGRPFGSDALRGRVYVANFIFTSCVLECPRLTRQMAHLQTDLAQFGDRVHLVSFSVDPRDDTPERLREYMARYHADPNRWTFVTGPEDAVLRAITDGFRVAVVLPPRAADGTFNPIELAHSDRFALIDAQGRLRAAIEADDDGFRQLEDALPRLIAEAGAR